MGFHLEVRVARDLARFLATHRERWLAHEATSIPFLRLVSASPGSGFEVVGERGAILATAYLRPGDQLLVSRATTEALAALGAALGEAGTPVPGIFGSAPSAAELATRLGGSYRLVKELEHLVLEDLREIPRPAGRVRLGSPHDRDAIAAHRDAAQAEGNTRRPFDSAASVAADLEAGAVFVWELPGGELAASAGLHLGRSPRSGYLDDVFTAREFRGRGVATALTHHLAGEARARGRVPRLAVDAANAAALRAYAKVGFRTAARMQNLRRAP